MINLISGMFIGAVIGAAAIALLRAGKDENRDQYERGYQDGKSAGYRQAEREKRKGYMMKCEGKIYDNRAENKKRF